MILFVVSTERARAEFSSNNKQDNAVVVVVNFPAFYVIKYISQ